MIASTNTGWVRCNMHDFAASYGAQPSSVDSRIQIATRDNRVTLEVAAASLALERTPTAE